MDAAVMMLTKPGTMSAEDWWLHVYVMLSRVRTARQILVYGLPPKQLFERGPPSFIEQGLARLTAMATSREEHYAELCSDMGFTSEVDVDLVSHPEEHQTPSQPIARGAARSIASKRQLGRCREQVQPSKKRELKNPLAKAFGRSAKTSPQSLCVEYEQPLVDSISNVTPHESRSSHAVQIPGHHMENLLQDNFEFWRERWAADCYSTPCAQADPFEPPEQDLQCISAVPFDVTSLMYGRAPGAFVNAGWRCDNRFIGLRNNQSNSCFINVVLQVLQRVQGFRICLEEHRLHCRRGVPECLFCSLNEDCKLQDVGTHISRSIFTERIRAGGLNNEVMDISFSGRQQCDALEFLDSLRGAWYAKEADRASHLAQNEGQAELALFDASRAVLREFVWGILLRARIFCEGCGVSSDRLYYDHEDVLKLQLPPDGSSCRLEELICRFSQPDDDKRLDCPAVSNFRCARGATRVTRQYFIEKEPSVLIMQLQRGQQHGQKRWKLQNNVTFPEILKCMRSGDYHFAAVVRHQGQHIRSGHYCINVWVGGGDYAEINCAPPRIQRLRWEDMQHTVGIQKEAYVLIYVRNEFRDNVGDGSEATPYTRDIRSKTLLQNRFRGERLIDEGDHVHLPEQVEHSSRRRRLGKKTSEAETVRASSAAENPSGASGAHEVSPQSLEQDRIQDQGEGMSLRATASSSSQVKCASFAEEQKDVVEQAEARRTLSSLSSSIGDSICQNTRRRASSRMSR